MLSGMETYDQQQRRLAKEATDRLTFADRIAKTLSLKPCAYPVESVYRGEVYICAGACLPCSARKYTDQYPTPVVTE